MTADLFEAFDRECWREEIDTGAVVLRRFCLPHAEAIWAALQNITVGAPFRHMVTPGGFRMSVAMTNCGTYGWVSDSSGYRYDTIDPESGRHWPDMPAVFQELAQNAAAEAGFPSFSPDACLINRYETGARLSLHQDKNERDLRQPIVSVSLGVPAVFLFGGLRREDRKLRIPLAHGDVVVWGGPARLYYHGILPLKEDYHHQTGTCRINITFRKAA
jgi:alkylated DNA repair protein (DNA oxidative demethylase)